MGKSGGVRGVTEAGSMVRRVSLTIEGEHWVCSAGFKERQTEISCNESPTKKPGILGLTQDTVEGGGTRKQVKGVQKCGSGRFWDTTMHGPVCHSAWEF